jgi:hypothetical protein
MDVEVGDRFPGVATVVDDHAKSRVGQAECLCDLTRCKQQFSQNGFIFQLRFPDAWDGLFGNYQHMYGRSRRNIMKSDPRFGFCDDFRGNFAGDDFLEEGAHGEEEGGAKMED